MESRVYFIKEVDWHQFRPTFEESQVELLGVWAEQYGVRMQVRVLRTMEHGLHVEWRVCNHNHDLNGEGQIPLTPGFSPVEAFEQGKEYAVNFAELWCRLAL